MALGAFVYMEMSLSLYEEVNRRDTSPWEGPSSRGVRTAAPGQRGCGAGVQPLPAASQEPAGKGGRRMLWSAQLSSVQPRGKS